ncbi:putative uncharacterized protein [Eubacterium sp. CAG:786]|nr:putative uncharacterized protein [Eubacterium sp. CAG:786]
MAFFDAKKLPKPKDEYVCFMDIMGIQSKMAHSISQSANYVFKLHSIILEAWRKSTYNHISIYPIMDGAYITSSNKEEMQNLLTYIFRALVKSLLEESDFKFWFWIRASLAYGKTIHGRNIPYDASYEFSTRVGYKEQLLFGESMILAYMGEKNAAPMGVFVDDSACRRVSSNWHWFNNQSIKVEQSDLIQFVHKMNECYEYMGNLWKENEYPLDKRQAHLEKFNEYFSFT